MAEMIIEGIGSRTEVPVLIPSLRAGRPDVGEALEVTLEAHRLLGFEMDDVATQSFTDRFGRLVPIGYDGRLRPAVPRTGVSTNDIIAAADGKRSAGVDETYRYPNL